MRKPPVMLSGKTEMRGDSLRCHPVFFVLLVVCVTALNLPLMLIADAITASRFQIMIVRGGADRFMQMSRDRTNAVIAVIGEGFEAGLI